MKDPLAAKVKEYIKKQEMIERHDRVLAAVSGGADSVFLLCMLESLCREMDFSLCAVHVEHGIRGTDSRNDAAFVASLCRGKNIPCRIVSVDAPAYAGEHHIGLEEAARILRYRVFEETAGQEDCQRIAVAHHMDDNAETMLFHLARGTGLAGLAGIPPVRGRVIRPLLGISRNEIEAWLLQKGESWCTDESNLDASFSRNRIRSEIMPEMNEINPMAARHMAETADLLRRTVGYLDREADRVLTACCKRDTDGSLLLETSELRQADPVLREHVFYRALQQAAGSAKDLTGEHVRSAEELCEKEVGKRVILPDGLVAEREYDLIRIAGRSSGAGDQENEPADLKETDLAIPGETVYGQACTVHADLLLFDGDMEKIPRKPYTKWLDYDKIEHSLQIRPRRTGDFLQIGREGGHKSIQDYMVEEKIPAKVRGQIPLIADGMHIVWVIGGRISEAYKVTRHTKHILALHVSDET